MKEITRTFTSHAMVAYAGATWDWHVMHYDRKHTDEAGVPGPIVDGQVFGALIAEQVQDHFGPAARITELSLRFKNMVFESETVTVRCTSVDSDASGSTSEHEVVCGDRLAATGKVTVEFRK